MDLRHCITDQGNSKPRLSMAGFRSPDSGPKPGEAAPEFSPQNLCAFVFICGFLLHGYGLVPSSPNADRNVGAPAGSWGGCPSGREGSALSWIFHAPHDSPAGCSRRRRLVRGFRGTRGVRHTWPGGAMAFRDGLAIRHRLAPAVLRWPRPADPVTFWFCGTCEGRAALFILRPTGPLPPRPCLAWSAPRRCSPGECPVSVRCSPEVDRVSLCGCCSCGAVLAFDDLTCISACTESFRTQYYCPVSGPDWSSRERLRSFAPAAMQAARSSCVRKRL